MSDSDLLAELSRFIERIAAIARTGLAMVCQDEYIRMPIWNSFGHHEHRAVGSSVSVNYWPVTLNGQLQ